MEIQKCPYCGMMPETKIIPIAKALQVSFYCPNDDIESTIVSSAPTDEVIDNCEKGWNELVQKELERRGL